MNNGLAIRKGKTMTKLLSQPLKIIGYLLLSIGVLIWVVAGLWGFFLELQIVNKIAGFWGLVIGFTILPITFFVAPFYALIAWGNWIPLVLIYGGGIGGTALYGGGSILIEWADTAKSSFDNGVILSESEQQIQDLIGDEDAEWEDQ